jgi:hypothetical protein
MPQSVHFIHLHRSANHQMPVVPLDDWTDMGGEGGACFVPD